MKIYFGYDAQSQCAHYIIDGLRFSSVNAVFHAAKSRGYDGTMQTIHRRLTRGLSTWAEVARQVPKAMSDGGKKSNSNKRAEMAELIRALDARKAAMS